MLWSKIRRQYEIILGAQGSIFSDTWFPSTAMVSKSLIEEVGSGFTGQKVNREIYFGGHNRGASKVNPDIVLY